MSAAAVAAVRPGFLRAFSPPVRAATRSGTTPGNSTATPAPTVTARRSHITRTIGTRNGFSSAGDEAPTRRRQNRAPSPVPLKPVREQEERPGQHRERERRPAADRLLNAASGRTTRDESIATPTKRKDAGGDREQPVDVPRVGEHRAPEDDERGRDDSAATHGTNGANLDFGSVAPSRTAAIGGTRVARIAGKRPARSVMPMPTTRATTIVLVAKTRSALGARHRDSRRALRSPRPGRRPARGRRATRRARSRAIRGSPIRESGVATLRSSAASRTRVCAARP